jgi:Zn-dependent M28 family amino/carboxypeptidase
MSHRETFRPRPAALAIALAVAVALTALPAAAATVGASGDTGLDAADLRTAAALRDAAAAGSPAFAIVEELTTTIGPRLAGTPADHRAVDWAEAKMKALGFDKVWREPVGFPLWQRGHAAATLLSGEGEATNEQPLAVTALGGSVGTGGRAIEAEVVEFADLAALQAAPDGSLAGKVAFVGYRMQRARDGSGYGSAVAARSNGASIAARKGAVALLIRSIGTSTHRFAHTGQMRYAEDAPKIPAAAMSSPDADQVSRLIARGETVRVRLDLAAATTGVGRSWNVIGEITGREAPGEFVTIGGHLDSWDQGTGAVDDGAGVAITMAAGAAIAELPTPPRRTVRVIAWASEENGLWGAREHAKNVGAGWADVQVAAESDFGAGRIYALRAGASPEAWTVLRAIGDVLAPLGIATEETGGGPGPDVGPLVALGVPWAQLAQDGTDYFELHHTPDDTLDKIEPKALDQQVAAYAAFAYLAAETTVDFGSVPKPQAAPPPANPAR